MPRTGFLRRLLAILVVAAVYFAAGKLGLKLAFASPSATAVWPPTGIALAALLLFGYRVWPGILLGAFLTNVTTAGSTASSVSIAVGNTLEALLGAYLVNRFAGGLHAFERTRNIFRFVLLAAILSTMVSATWGVTTLAIVGLTRWADYGTVWLTWWLGDAVGALVVAPLLVLWHPNNRVIWRKYQLLEAAALLLTLLAAATLVFGGVLPPSARNYPLEFVCIPILLWAAIRFGQRDGATAVLLLAGMAIHGTILGFGPFVARNQNVSLLLQQAFIGVTALMTLVVASGVAERKRLELSRERVIHELQEALDGIKTLKGLLSICASCKRVRDDQGAWNQIETYIRQHSEADFTHGICPTCAEKLYPNEYKRVKKRTET